MKKIEAAIIIGLIILSAVAVFWQKKMKQNEDGLDLLENMGIQENNQQVREPAVAGQFYPADPKILRETIEGFLTKANPPKTEGEIFGLVAPHAGYQFSGQVAAYGFKELMGKEIDTVILIGPNHYEAFDGISIFPRGAYKTPLGNIEIDSDLAAKITNKSERIFFHKAAHSREHCLEVELPFLEVVLGRFKIVPIIFGSSGGENYRILARAISESIGNKKVLLVASSDLSHYPPYEYARKADGQTIKAILSGDVGKLEETISQLKSQNIPQAVTFACGLEAIKTLMEVSKTMGAAKIKLLKYANSGDTLGGDKSQVVGYGAIGFFKEEKEGNAYLSREEQKELLRIARQSAEGFIKEGKIPDFYTDNEKLSQKLGAFVTLKKDNRLRGCIGVFSPTDRPLYHVVSQMAVAAAVEDNRFEPVREEELKNLDYEISVLSPLKRIKDWRQIKLGEEGVEVRRGLAKGVFLPQVATENNLSLEEFLSELCSHKAGLEPDCYKNKETEIYVFTAQVFSN